MNFAELKNTKRGFTLIEILVVIAIIGILSSVVLASLAVSRAKARDARRIADLEEVKKALELYYDSNGEYPISVNSVPSPLPPVLVSAGFIPLLPITPTGAIAYKYLGTNTLLSPPLLCSNQLVSSTGYVLGAQLELYDNIGLTTDADTLVYSSTCAQPIFDGRKGDCLVNGPGGPQPGGGPNGERCFDIRP